MPFPLFHSHLDFAHHYWKQLIQPDSLIIDATCGNGHDTLILTQLGLTDESGSLYGLDIQPQAISSTQELLKKHLSHLQYSRVKFFQQCHSSFPAEISPNSAHLIVYNLGYLPKGNKELTTMTTTTLLSLENAKKLLCEGGVLSITCYPGHAEGMNEEDALLNYFGTLNRNEWNCSHHRWINRQKGPSLLLIQKQKTGHPKQPDSILSDG